MQGSSARLSGRYGDDVLPCGLKDLSSAAPDSNISASQLRCARHLRCGPGGAAHNEILRLCGADKLRLVIHVRMDHLDNADVFVRERKPLDPLANLGHEGSGGGVEGGRAARSGRAGG